MCGIIFISGNIEKYGKKLIDARRSIRHRGPDSSGIFNNGKVVMLFERLAITGHYTIQPIVNNDIATMTNGEFYNYKQFYGNYIPKTDCDSEAAIPLYLEHGDRLFEKIIHGIFATVVYDIKNNKIVIARDRIGIIPLYFAIGENTFVVASELKAIEILGLSPNVFPPGYVYSKNENTGLYSFQPYYDYWIDRPITSNDADKIKENINRLLTKSTHMRLECEVPYACLLSGGVDSSIVAAIAARYLKGRDYHKLRTYSVGFEDSPDILAAREVAKFIDSDHVEVIISIEEALNAIPDVIYYLETYDITTIRAATPMFLLARRIKADGYKVVLSGEGSDEMFGGYAYFKYAPNEDEMRREVEYKVRNLYKYDCLRANKSLMAWGVEGRFPFLDIRLLDYVMTICPLIKMQQPEKNILRLAFEGYIPHDILWRKKEQFSDGVGNSWISAIKKYVDVCVNDEAILVENYLINPSWNKEGYYYRAIFNSYFYTDSAVLSVPNEKSIACSSEKALQWFKKEMNIDPSGSIS